jgi:hypothetical protein
VHSVLQRVWGFELWAMGYEVLRLENNFRFSS